MSVAEDLDGSVPKAGYTSIDFPVIKNFNGKLKKLRYYPSAVYKDLAGRGKYTVAKFNFHNLFGTVLLQRGCYHCVILNVF